MLFRSVSRLLAPGRRKNPDLPAKALSWCSRVHSADRWKALLLAAVIRVVACPVILALLSGLEALLASGRPENCTLPDQSFARKIGMESQAGMNR